MKISKRTEHVGGIRHQSLCIEDEGHSLIFRKHGLENEYLEMIQIKGVSELGSYEAASIDDALEALSRIHLLTGEYIHRLISPNAPVSELEEELALYG